MLVKELKNIIDNVSYNEININKLKDFSLKRLLCIYKYEKYGNKF